jgi:hypothetical protein
MFLFVATLADTDPEAAQLVTDIFTLTRPLSALHEPPWPEKRASSAVQPSPS